MIGDWYGIGRDRGMALLFSVAGLIGLIVTLVAMRSAAYRVLATHYQQVRLTDEYTPIVPLQEGV